MLEIFGPITDRLLVQGFGENPEWYCQYRNADGTVLQGHNGVDLVGAYRSKIKALWEGQAWTYEDPGYGRVAEIWYPGIPRQFRPDVGDTDLSELQFKLLYAHLDFWLVSDGQCVVEGQDIGVQGYTGNCKPSGQAGTHLHLGFKIYQHGAKNPAYNNWVDIRPFLRPEE